MITQSSGKQRIIDNADAGGQTLRSSDANKLVLCSPLRPAQRIGQVLRHMSSRELAQAYATDTWESGGEDWPDAYRHSPMGVTETRGCVVTFWHHEWAAPAFQVYAGLLFGLPLAVTSFNRYSRLVEALGRRLCYVLVSLYFDDASVFEPRVGSVGFRYPEPTSGYTMCGGETPCHEPQGFVSGFGPRPVGSLESKLKAIIHDCRKAQTLKPGVAAKLYGLANFFEQGVYGRIGCGGLHLIKERQLVRGDQMTSAFEQCFQILEAVISIHPERELDVWPRHHERFVAASDAALETPGEGAGGFLLVFFQESVEVRLGFVSHLPPSTYDLWTPGDAKIAQLELLQVLMTTTPERFCNRHGAWYLDNTAALMALIKGRSDSPDLEHMSHMIHILLFSLRCWIYFEWIPSKSNWSDAISRKGHADRWHHDQGFTSPVATFFKPLWYFPFPATLRAGLFL